MVERPYGSKPRGLVWNNRREGPDWVTRLSTRPRRATQRRRGGYVYLVVLMVSVILTIIGISALGLARLQLKASTANSDWAEAQLLAQSAIENAVMEVNSDANWRNNRANNTEYPSAGTALGRGKYTWKLVDSDNDLRNDATDSVRLVGIGRVGSAVYATSVMLEPRGSALTCLETSLHAQGKLELGYGRLVSDQTVSTNDDSVASNGVMVAANVEAARNVNGTTYLGVIKPSAPARSVPSKPDSVLSYYLDNGTYIPASSLGSGTLQIQQCLLGPSVNPFGDHKTNPEGIYVVDCGNKDMVISNCRIVGTLVLVNPGANTTVQGCVSMEPAVEYYPSLVVRGKITINCDPTPLYETGLGRNFNPAGAPFPFLAGRSGNADSDTTDEYPSEITGLVYASGDILVTAGSPSFDGVVVSGGSFKMTTTGKVTLHYRETYLVFPPPGFSAGNQMEIEPNSWKRELAP